ncbi:MAG: hypothetical protein AB7P04_09220 [Bacteriovoracia bacterium]
MKSKDTIGFRNLATLIALAVSAAGATPASAANAANPAKVTKSAAAAPAAKPAAGQVIWNNWYTVTLNGKTPYAYYNERLSIKDGKLHYQNDVWKKEEDFINRESFGGFAENNSTYTPIFYNFFSTYRTSETKIDGTVGADNVLSLKIRKDGKDLPVVKKHLPKGVFFSTYFPLWLRDNVADMKPGQPRSFSTILEDSIDTGFKVESGHARVEAPDEFAKKTGTKRVAVQYRDMPSIWWTDDKGNYVRMEMGRGVSAAELVPEAKAKKFLDTK